MTQWSNVCRCSAKKYKSLPFSEDIPVCMKLVIAWLGTLTARGYATIKTNTPETRDAPGALVCGNGVALPLF